MARKWNPAHHPRDSKGRFTKSATRVMKASDTSRVRSILGGLKPRSSGTRQDALGYLSGLVKGRPIGDAAAAYLNGEWKTLHPAMRSAKPDPKTAETVAAIDAEMVELTEDVQLIRDVPIKMFAHIPMQDLEGMKVRDAAYAPTMLKTSDGPEKPAGGVRMHMVAPAGTKALINAPDGEVILGHDTEVAISRVEPDGQGGWDIYGVVIPTTATVKARQGRAQGGEGDAPASAAAGDGTSPKSRTDATSAPADGPELRPAGEDDDEQGAAAAADTTTAGTGDASDAPASKPVEAGTTGDTAATGTGGTKQDEDDAQDDDGQGNAVEMAVEDLEPGAYVHVEGVDQYGKPTKATGYAGRPSPVTMKKNRRAKTGQPMLAVPMSETPSGGGGWRTTVYVSPDATAELMPEPADTARLRGEPADAPDAPGTPTTDEPPAGSALAALSPVDRAALTNAVEDAGPGIFQSPMTGGSFSDVGRYVSEGPSARPLVDKYGADTVWRAVEEHARAHPEVLARTPNEVKARQAERTAAASGHATAAAAATKAGDYAAARAEIDAGELVNPTHQENHRSWDEMRAIVARVEQKNRPAEPASDNKASPAAGTGVPAAGQDAPQVRSPEAGTDDADTAGDTAPAADGDAARVGTSDLRLDDEVEVVRSADGARAPKGLGRKGRVIDLEMGRTVVEFADGKKPTMAELNQSNLRVTRTADQTDAEPAGAAPIAAGTSVPSDADLARRLIDAGVARPGRAGTVTPPPADPPVAQINRGEVSPLGEDLTQPAPRTAGTDRMEDPQYRADYEQGWTDGADLDNLDGSDDKPEAWHHGFTDRYAGAEKWSATKRADQADADAAAAAAQRPAPTSDTWAAHGSPTRAWWYGADGQPEGTGRLVTLSQGDPRPDGTIRDITVRDANTGETVEFHPASRTMWITPVGDGEGGTGTEGTSAPAAAPADLDSRVRAAYHELADRPGRYVNLTDLRAKLPDVDKADLDRALTRMLDSDDVNLEPEPFGHRIGPAEKAAAVHVGGEDRHKIAISGAVAAASTPEGGPETPRAAALLATRLQSDGDYRGALDAIAAGERLDPGYTSLPGGSWDGLRASVRDSQATQAQLPDDAVGVNVPRDGAAAAQADGQAPQAGGSVPDARPARKSITAQADPFALVRSGGGGSAIEDDLFGDSREFQPQSRGTIGVADRADVGRERAIAATQQLGLFASDEREIEGQAALLGALLDMPPADPPPASAGRESDIPDDLSGWSDEQLSGALSRLSEANPADYDEQGLQRIAGEWDRREAAMRDAVAAVPEDLSTLSHDDVAQLFAEVTSHHGTMDSEAVARLGAELDRRDAAHQAALADLEVKRSLLAQPVESHDEDGLAAALDAAGALDDEPALQRIMAEYDRREAAAAAEQAAAEQQAAEAHQESVRAAEQATTTAAQAAARREQDEREAAAAVLMDQLEAEGVRAEAEDAAERLIDRAELADGDSFRQSVPPEGEDENMRELARMEEFDRLDDAQLMTEIIRNKFHPADDKRAYAHRAALEHQRRKALELQRQETADAARKRRRMLTSPVDQLTDDELRDFPALLQALPAGQDRDKVAAVRGPEVLAEARRRQAVADERAARQAAGPAGPARVVNPMAALDRIDFAARAGMGNDNWLPARLRLTSAQARVYGLDESQFPEGFGRAQLAKAIDTARKKDPRDPADQAAHVLAWYRFLGEFDDSMPENAPDWMRGFPDEPDLPEVVPPLPPDAGVKHADRVLQEMLKQATADRNAGDRAGETRFYRAMARAYRIPFDPADTSDDARAKLASQAAEARRLDKRPEKQRAAAIIAEWRRLADEEGVDPSDTARYGPVDKSQVKKVKIGGVWRTSSPADEARIDRLIADGYDWTDAYAEVYGIDPDALKREQADEMIRAAAGGKPLAQAYRQHYDEMVMSAYEAAETGTRGHLLNDAGRKAGFDPVKLFSGPSSTAYKYASEELKRWWAANPPPRMTFAEFKRAIQGDASLRDELLQKGKGNEFA